MLTPPNTGRKPGKALALSLNVAFGVLWVMGLVLVCLPAWGAGLVLTKMANLCLWLGFSTKDKLERAGDAVENLNR